MNVEVINSTTHPNLAQQAGRILSIMGLRVVNIGNNKDDIGNCLVLSSLENKRSFVVNKITSLFKCNWRKVDREIKGDVQLILGEKYWQKLNGD